MARSKRHTPIASITTARSEKADKRFANRKLRVAVRKAMRDDNEIMPELREVSNIYAFAKDGKVWWLGYLLWPHRRR